MSFLLSLLPVSAVLGQQSVFRQWQSHRGMLYGLTGLDLRAGGGGVEGWRARDEAVNRNCYLRSTLQRAVGGTVTPGWRQRSPPISGKADNPEDPGTKDPRCPASWTDRPSAPAHTHLLIFPLLMDGRMQAGWRRALWSHLGGILMATAFLVEALGPEFFTPPRVRVVRLRVSIIWIFEGLSWYFWTEVSNSWYFVHTFNILKFDQFPSPQKKNNLCFTQNCISVSVENIIQTIMGHHYSPF